MNFDDFDQAQGHASPFMEQIDEVCDDFEAAWQRGSRIRIENCLRLVPDEACGELLRELLEIEIAMRMQNGESVLLENYLSRFPEHADVVKAVMQRHTGRRRLGDYELLEQLGRGGMGVVYKARQIYLNQIVAIKILPEQYMGDSHALSRFRREMQLIGGLNHPNIVQAYNAGEADGMHYLVMEYVAGVTLQRLIAEMVNAQFEGQNKLGAPIRTRDVDAMTLPHMPVDHATDKTADEFGNLPPTEVDPPMNADQIAQTANTDTVPEEQTQNNDNGSDAETLPVRVMSVGAACEAIRQTALGLHHAHQRGLVHRDIKPGNLMLERHGLIKVLDLGLGKFQADVMQVERSTGPLTQAGTTMGTVDYMAPEQWDDPATVDIRADIYSLGNTLFFLLCGSPPFDGKNYGSNREKLMAHIVAEPPSLRKRCPDVPPELEAVYMKLVAKEPGDRYQTPIEVVEALEPFADIDALIECIPQELKNISDADQSTSSQYDNSVGRDTIASYPLTPSRRRRISELAPQPKPWYKRQGFYGLIAVFNIALFLIAVMLVSRLWREDADEPPHNGRQIVVPDDLPLRRYDPTERDAIAADLVELPGLSGSTWFSEMPWFTPFVRREAANALRQTEKPDTVLGPNLRGYLDADTLNVQQWLWSLTEKTRGNLNAPQQRLVDDLKALADSNLDGNAYADRVEAAMQNYVAGKGNLPHRAADSNTEAMLLHLLADLRGDKNLAEQARHKYQEALDAYGDDVVSQQLKLLCMTDMARLTARTLGDYDGAHEMYGKAMASQLATNLLKVEIFTALGMELAGIGQYNDRNFRIALQLLTDPNRINIGNNHPLVAHVLERHAWSLIDQWQVDEAQKMFGEALIIRKANSREGKNPFADIYVLHNRHGLAMTTRFRGDPVSARQQFAGIVADIDEKLAEAETVSQSDPEQLRPGQLRYFRELRERSANSRYRWADCELFGGAASGESGLNLAQAELLYDKAREMTNDRTTRVLLTVKLSMIRALLGKIPEANVSLDELNPVFESILSTDARYRARQAISLMQQIVKVCETEQSIDPNDPTPESLDAYAQEIDRFRRLLQRMVNEHVTSGEVEIRHNRNRHDSLEFRLFCSEFLLTAEQKHRQLAGITPPVRQEDLMYLLGAFDVFKGRREMTPYLRRYYDLVVHLADKTGPGANYLVLLLSSKLGPPPDFAPGNDVGDAWLLLFHFSRTDNFAVLQKDDDDTPTFCPLALTRQQIEDAANMGREIEPPPELREIFNQVAQARAAGRIVNIYWSDAACWTHEKDALLDDDWPFKSLLPLRVPAPADDDANMPVPIYIGTYTGGGNDAAKGVYLTTLDPADGSLTEARLAAEVPNPSFLAKHPTQPWLYAVTEQGRGTDGSPVHAFAIDTESFALTSRNTQNVPALGACHLGVFSSGANSLVAVACYHEGAVATLPVLADGTLGPCATFVRHEGAGPNSQRQEQSHAHAVYEWAPNIIVVPDLGADKLFFYETRPDASFAPWPELAQLSVPPGSGPRHMAFSRATRTAFVLNELSSTINVVAYDPSPQIVQTVSTLPGDININVENSTAEIFMHPNGRFLYASNRGHDSIALFHFDATSRQLTLLETTPCGGKWPRSFDLSPCGRWLICAAQMSDLVTTFRITPEDGRLTPTGHQITIKNPACVLPVSR